MRAVQQPEPRGGLFVDVSAQSGVDFLHDNGATGDLLLPEIMGPGGALLDCDEDGDLDLYVVQGAVLKPEAHEGTVGRKSPTAPRDRLYRNDLQVRPDGTRALRFSDVTGRSGIDARGYGMGAATGDFNNDGRVDLYVTNLGPNQMFRNDGDCTFSDVTAETGTDDPRWSTSSTFFDYDGDGWLDLFVTNYLRFTADMTRDCFSRGSARDYCNPEAYDPVPSRLFRNNRNGTFTDVSVPSGIAGASGRGLGVLAIDANADGWLDLYVANDGDPNQLWINGRGSGRFTDQGLLAGVALNRLGQTQGSMGIDAGDVDGDGDEDLFVTNLDNEGSTFYANLGNGLFEDRTIEAGLLRPSLGRTGFGARFLDYDNDGSLDLLVVNGAVRFLAELVRQGDPYPLKQRNQLFRNDGRGRFAHLGDAAGPAFALLGVSRGLAVGDLDNDGRPDAVVFNNSGPVRVLRNTAATRHWLGVRIIDGRSRRDALHTRVEMVQRGGTPIWRRVQTDGSYLSASDPRVVFGLGSDAAPPTIRVHWPRGGVEEFRDLAVDRYWELESGRPPRAR